MPADDFRGAHAQVPWFPALVATHGQDLIDRDGADGSVVPPGRTNDVAARTFSADTAPARVGATHGAFVPDAIGERFGVLGTGERVIAQLREREAIGGAQVTISLMAQDQEETLEACGRDILPQFSGVVA